MYPYPVSRSGQLIPKVTEQPSLLRKLRPRNYGGLKGLFSVTHMIGRAGPASWPWIATDQLQATNAMAGAMFRPPVPPHSCAATPGLQFTQPYANESGLTRIGGNNHMIGPGTGEHTPHGLLNQRFIADDAQQLFGIEVPGRAARTGSRSLRPK